MEQILGKRRIVANIALAIAFVALPLAVVSAAEPALVTPQQQIKIPRLDADIASMRMLLPIRIDDATQLVDVYRVGLRINLTFNVALGAKVLDDNRRKRYSAATIESVCGMEDMRELLNMGFALSYDHISESGVPIANTYMDKASCR